MSNVLLVHYADLIHDKIAQVKKIAEFIDINNLDSKKAEMILDKSSLAYMRENSEKFEHRDFEKHRFIYRGTNGRWQNWLSDRQLDRYEELMAQKLDLACANWVKNGGNLPAIDG